MKKITWTIAAAALSLASCATTDASADLAAENPAEETRTVVAEFESNPTTGFSWQCEVADTSVAEFVSREYEPYPHDEGVVGGGGTDRLTIALKKAGETDVTFTYRRPWEGGETAATQRARLTVREGDDGLECSLDFTGQEEP